MNESLRSFAEFAGSVAAGTVLAVAVLRHLAVRWLKDREEFEKAITAEVKAVNVKVDGSKEYADRGDKAVREEGAEARRVLREHVDREDAILRDRTHSLDTRTQIIANNVGLLREEIVKLTEAQGETTEALHHLDVTLAKLIPKG